MGEQTAQAAAAKGIELHVVKTNKNGTTMLIFGDGKYGARLPIGTDNVTVIYTPGTTRPCRCSKDT